MSEAGESSRPRERCWFCDQPILRGEATRTVPGMGLTVHSSCYEQAVAPPPSLAPDDE